ncbi:MAG TPA: isochorismate synthase [Ignavibacteriaceae bacterium]|nr:isochorismate synthase [Ignavibacteriaceae bacterium]
MEEFISAAVDSLADFLKQKKSAFQSFKNGEILISFIHQVNKFSGKISIDDLLKNNDPVFYFEKPDEEYKITGISKTAVIIENGNQRFSSADKKIKEFKERCLNNWEAYNPLNIPLLFAAVKFTPEHSDNEWKNFSDAVWIIPELILIEDRNKNDIIFNSVVSSAALLKNLPGQFGKILENILSLDQKKNTPAAHQKQVIKVQKIEGNLPKDKKKWKNQVTELIQEISADNIQKVVLSRKVELVLTNEFNFSEILDKLSKRFSNCYIFLYSSGESVFFGASPEKLIKFQHTTAEFDVIAGSASRGISSDEDTALENALLSSSKNINEHKIVLDYILNSIKPFAEDLTVSKTQVKKYSNIQHLWTRVLAHLQPDFSLHALLKAVYPTPSICGVPKEKALGLIKKLEGYKRGLYSGLIGWMNFNNSGEFVIAIRSALYCRRKLAIFAGNGIVKESNAEDEWKETELKLNPILSLFDENKNK